MSLPFQVLFLSLEHKKACLLSYLLQTFNSYLPSDAPRDLSGKHSSVVSPHFGDSTVVQTQRGQGKSNLIMSSSITLGDTIKEATNLKAELNCLKKKLDNLIPDQ